MQQLGLWLANPGDLGMIAPDQTRKVQPMRIRTVPAMLFVAIVSAACATDFETGTAAYNQGDYATALREFSQLAERGDAGAQYKLGVMHYYGEGVPQNFAEAVVWFRRAAEQDDAEAIFKLGVMYDRGEGVARDVAEARARYRRAAELGYAKAQNNVGNMYYLGFGVAQDYAEAVGWYRRAAEQGYPYAQYNLALRYENGEGVPKDYVESFAWYNLAATQDYDNSLERRDDLLDRMTPDQVAAAQNLSRDLGARITRR